MLWKDVIAKWFCIYLQCICSVVVVNIAKSDNIMNIMAIRKKNCFVFFF